MGNFTRPIEMAPLNLNQPILPGWQFSLFQIDLGNSGDPDLENALIDSVGSYGRQIGHIADALDAVLHKLGLDRPDALAADAELSDDQKKAVQTFLDDVTTVRTVKRTHAPGNGATAQSPSSSG